MCVGESSGSGGDPCKSLTSTSLDSNNSKGSNSDISCHDDDEDVIIDDDDAIDDDALEDPDYDSDYYDDDIFEDDYSFMQDQFDNADLPPGVEASLPWLKDIGSSDCKQAVAHVNPESSSKGQLDESSDTVMQNFQQFKQFDTVDSFPDHFYDKKAASTSEAQVIYIEKVFLSCNLHPIFSRISFSRILILLCYLQRPKNWAKKIQEEWKILEENLPGKVSISLSASQEIFIIIANLQNIMQYCHGFFPDMFLEV
jgi:ubiquitin-conjugating enzyme E2 O